MGMCNHPWSQPLAGAGWRQIAAATSTYHVFRILLAQNDDKNFKYTVIRNNCIVGAATCRPPRSIYNLFGRTEPPNIRNKCSGDDSSPSNVTNITRSVERNHPPTCHPDRVKRAEGSTQVADFTMRRKLLLLGKIPPLRFATVGMTYQGVVPVNRTSCIRNVAWWCSAQRIKID